MAGFIDQAAVHLMHWSILPVAFPPPGHIPLGFVTVPHPPAQRRANLSSSRGLSITVLKQVVCNIDQVPVVQTLDSTVHWINLYPVDSAIGFPNTYPQDSDLSDGYRYPTFEQPGPDQYNIAGSHVYTGAKT